MFKINYLNITLWILIAILTLILFVIIIWRIIIRNDNNKNNFAKNKLFTSNKLMDLSRSLNQIYEISSLVNILFKNKFANDKFSLITLLSFKKRNTYLILNPIKIDINSKIDNTNQNKIYYQYKNKDQKLILNLFMKFYVFLNQLI